MKKKSTYRLFATGNLYGMTEADYKLFHDETPKDYESMQDAC